MRPDLNNNDPLPELGNKVERPAPPTPQVPPLRPTGTPGVFQRPDGTLITDIPIRNPWGTL